MIYSTVESPLDVLSISTGLKLISQIEPAKEIANDEKDAY